MPAFVTPIERLLRLCLREACATAIAIAHAVGDARRSVHLQQTIKHLIVKHDLV